MIISDEIIKRNVGAQNIKTEEDMLATLTMDNVLNLYRYTGPTTENYQQNHYYMTWPEKLPLGGQIFYTSVSWDWENGAAYRFYDEDDNPILSYDERALANAKTYQIFGTPTRHGIYVVDTTLGKVNGTWGCDGIITGNTSDGLTNTLNILNNYSDSMGTIWTHIRDIMNAQSIGSHNDWYVGTSGMYDKVMANLGMNCRFVWTSTESDASKAIYRRWSTVYGDKWVPLEKTREQYCLPIRSF